MNISVVICAYTLDRWDDLCDAVSSVQAQTRPADDIVLVVDYNDELFLKATETFSVRVIPNQETKGLSGARNSGVAASTGDIIVFLDDDARAEPTWLAEIIVPFDDPRVAGVGGWVLPRWSSETPTWFPDSFLWVVGCSYDGLPPSGAHIRNPIGASMALRRDVCERTGGFHAGLGRIGTTPLGGEETELCIRYATTAPEDYFVLRRESVVHHHVPAGRTSLSYLVRRCWSEGLSKAAIAAMVGPEHALDAERGHAMRVIPRALRQALVTTVRHPQTRGRALVAVLAGFATAVAGYLWGRSVLRRRQPVAIQDSWRPVPIRRIVVEEPVRDIAIDNADQVWVEVVRDGQVVGRRVVAIDHSVLTFAQQTQLAKQFSTVAVESLDDFDGPWPRATVIVPTICQRADELVASVTMLLGLDYPDFEIVIVDNRRDASTPFPDLPGGDRVRVVRAPQPGLSAARNHGLAAATTDIVAFTDDDVLVDPQWLRAICRRFAVDERVVGIGGLVQPAELSTPAQLWFEEYFGGFSQSHELIMSGPDFEEDDPLFPYAPGRFGAGCNMGFRRSALAEIGGFVNTLGTGTPAKGGEDLEVWITLASRGATLAFEPRALVRHTHRNTLEALETQAYGYGAGLTAMYANLVLTDPRHLVVMAKRLPLARRRLGQSRADRRPTEVPSFPASLHRREREGMLAGPVLYLKSAWALRSMTPTPAPFTGKRTRRQ